MQWMRADRWAASPSRHDPRTLGIAVIGGTGQVAPASDLPQARLLTPVNDASEPIVEVWSGRHVARDRTMGDVRCRDNGEVLFATVSVAAADGEDAFGQATYVAYRSLL